MSICYPLVVPTWYPLLSFTWNSIPGEARCGVFLRNLVTYRDHLPLDIFGGWHLWTSPLKQSVRNVKINKYKIYLYRVFTQQ